jgi:hypothetical protein
MTRLAKNEVEKIARDICIRASTRYGLKRWQSKDCFYGFCDSGCPDCPYEHIELADCDWFKAKRESA